MVSGLLPLMGKGERSFFITVKLGNNSTIFINGRRLLKRGLAGF